MQNNETHFFKLRAVLLSANIGPLTLPDTDSYKSNGRKYSIMPVLSSTPDLSSLSDFHGART